jgi:ferrochelatase
MSDTGVLVANLGTPDAPTPTAVRRFLAEFLWDRRVVDLPRLPWWLLLNGVVLPFRPRRSARAYRQIWTDAGSPLMTGTQAVVTALERRLESLLSPAPAVVMGMTYGNPSIAVALATLPAAGIRRLVVLPLYPQFSRTTTASVLDRVQAAIARWPAPPELSVIENYHAEPDHIAAIAGSITARGTASPTQEHLLFSFHGIPRRTVDAGDPYGVQCQTTARLVAERLALAPGQWSVAFQSRVGGARWLEPYTEQRLAALARDGIRGLSVICPGFAVDCLETLEEIAIRGRATFLAAGGERFDYIPALNDEPAQIDCFARLVAARAGAGRGR